MMFSDRLDFLMTLTKTSNAQLSRVISLDPSYISRLRSGERNPHKDATYISAIAEYIVVHCRSEFCKEALFEKILGRKHSSSEYSQEYLANLIEQWLITGSNLPETQTLTGEFDSSNTNGLPRYHKSMTTIYYGVSGLVSSLTNFFELILSRSRSKVLFIFSSTENRKVLENPKYAIMINDWLSKVLEKGFEIKVIHSLSKNSNDVFASINTWLPFYMSGSVEVYYYPYKGVGEFKHLSLVVPETAAITSNYFSHMTENMLTMFINGRKPTGALAKEFEYLLSHCHPLFHSIRSDRINDYKEVLFSFESSPGDGISKTSGLSVRSMPKKVVENMLLRISGDAADMFRSVLDAQINKLDQCLKEYKLFEIVCLEDFETIKNNLVHSPFSSLFTRMGLNYTAEEYRLHLENIIAMLRKYENYSVILKDSKISKPYSFSAKEDFGVVFSSNEAPAGIFFTNEKHVTAAFYESLKDEIETWNNRDNKSESIVKLEALVAELNGLAVY